MLISNDLGQTVGTLNTNKGLAYICAESGPTKIDRPHFLGGVGLANFPNSFLKLFTKKEQNRSHQIHSIRTLRRCVLRCHQRRQPGFGTFTATCAVMLKRKPGQRKVGALMLKGVHLGIQKASGAKKLENLYSIQK